MNDSGHYAQRVLDAGARPPRPEAPDRPADPGLWYTGGFNGTSSAAAIVAGAVANLQGIALAQSGVPLPPLQTRTLLVQTGSPQLGNIAEPIGPRPNLLKAAAQIPCGPPR